MNQATIYFPTPTHEIRGFYELVGRTPVAVQRVGGGGMYVVSASALSMLREAGVPFVVTRQVQRRPPRR